MTDYVLGKDIQELKNRLDRLEEILRDCDCGSPSGQQDEEEERMIEAAVELDSEDPQTASGYKWIIFRASIRRQCRREPPFNKAYSWFWVKCWSHLGKEKDDPTGPPFDCRRMELSYNHGSKVGIDTSAISHHAAHIRHCHGATLTGRFRAYEGSDVKVVQVNI